MVLADTVSMFGSGSWREGRVGAGRTCMQAGCGCRGWRPCTQRAAGWAGLSGEATHVRAGMCGQASSQRRERWSILMDGTFMRT